MRLLGEVIPSPFLNRKKERPLPSSAPFFDVIAIMIIREAVDLLLKPYPPKPVSTYYPLRLISTLPTLRLRP